MQTLANRSSSIHFVGQMRVIDWSVDWVRGGMMHHLGDLRALRLTRAIHVVLAAENWRVMRK